MSHQHECRALLINGTVGVGKTSVADAIGSQLRESRLPGSVIDLDWLGNAWPTPEDDPFNLSLTLQNVAAGAANAITFGARHLILAGVVENHDQRAQYAAAVGMPLKLCRLRADLDTVRDRLRLRHPEDPKALAWHLHRCGELNAILDQARVDDFIVDTTDRTIEQTAVDVIGRWFADAIPVQQ
ncbi:MAG: hypothetical protein H0T91_08530 [Propionibacteriaceae bacterium]|nr:hypothetical protein [Propionibacteriaceae bacterium]